MSGRKIIIFLIVLLVILMFIIILTSNKINKENKYINTSSSNNSRENEQNVNNETNSIENTATEDIDYNNSDYIFDYEQENGEARYTKETIDSLEFKIEGMPDEVLNYINDINEFEYKVKEYIYLNGLIDASVASYKEYEIMEEENGICITFSLNNENQTIMDVTINLEDNSLTFGRRN